MGLPPPDQTRRREPMTLAVLNGTDKGVVLRTGRSRIVVGSAAECDLVLGDSDVDAHHFFVVVDEAGWRAQTTSPKHQIVIDRRWAHPTTGRRGALIYAGGTEILLYPGDLDDATIGREIHLRSTADVTPPEAAESGDVTRIATRPRHFDRDMHSLPPPAGDGIDNTAPTIQMPRVDPKAPIDPIALASMPTLAGSPIPVAVQEAAQRGMRPEETPLPLRVPGGPDGATARSAWERSVRPPIPATSTEPMEVLAEPESRISRLRPSQGYQPSSEGPTPPGESRALVRLEPNAWGTRTSSSERASWDPGAPRSGHAGKRSEPVPPHRSSTAPIPGNAPWTGPGNHRGSSPPPPQTSGRRDAERNGQRTPSLAVPVGTPFRPSLPTPGFEIAAAALAKKVDEPGLELLHNPDGNFATAIRVFGTRLLDLARTYGYRAYMLSSPEPLTGKTTVATNLALALAEDPKRRVALIEANFRCPRVAEILGAPEKHGLLAILEGRQQVTEAILRFPDRNLVVFPSGGRHPHPGEVLASPRFKTLMAELASTVDVAIIDAPSVRPFADANLLLPLVDGALLVVLEGATRRAWIDKALEQLGQERVLGALFNHVDPATRRALAKERSKRLHSKGVRP